MVKNRPVQIKDMTKGLVISGELGNILIRQKAGERLEIGELLFAEPGTLLQVFDLLYGSQISQQHLELMSGIVLEDNADIEFFDEKLRYYTLARTKNLLEISGITATTSKTLPAIFSPVRAIRKEDITFLTKPRHALALGKLRSGSKTVDVDIFLDGKEIIKHHILIPATTGRGKSNVVKTMLWNSLSDDYCGMLVLDPHDEYYGRSGNGLKDHPRRDRTVYYTPSHAPPGTKTLKINLRTVRPEHLNGVVSLSDAQHQALAAYYRKYGNGWVESIIEERKLDVAFHEGTLAVVKRVLLSLFDLRFVNNKIMCTGIFDLEAGETTISDITAAIEQRGIVIIDTSDCSSPQEILVGSIIATDILKRFKRAKQKGELDTKPVVGIVLEEAPRVLGKEVLALGPNIFSTIAREGRKFQVGLIAITQLPSLIPRDILANMNTKIILGLEMAPERQAIIDSDAQDLSSDNRAIASLDKGEGIISSTFSRFALPVSFPLFDTIVKSATSSKSSSSLSYSDMIHEP